MLECVLNDFRRYKKICSQFSLSLVGLKLINKPLNEKKNYSQLIIMKILVRKTFTSNILLFFLLTKLDNLHVGECE